MKVVAVIPAAGKGIRLRNKTLKPLVLLNSHPILIHTLKILSRSRLINDIILVVNKNYLRRFENKIKQYNLKKIKKIVAGGATRKQSVRNGLRVVDKDTDLVFIHDGVRPFIDLKIISRSIKVAREFGAAVVGVPVKSTIKEINSSSSVVKSTLKRDTLWEIQTPQVFKRSLIMEAYDKSKNIQASDDASLVEKIGKDVKIICGSYKNIKITTPEDLLFAEAIIKNKKF